MTEILLQAQAKALYLSGMKVDDISKTLSIPIKTIYNWSSEQKWGEDRIKFLQGTTNNLLKIEQERQIKTFEELRTLREKAMEAITREEDPVKPQKYSEAANAYIASLDMERKLKIEALELNFITDVADILRDEIKDKELLDRIANRFRKLYAKYQNNPLPPVQGVPE